MALRKLSSAVQRKGQVTIPQEMREAFDIKPGDEVYFRISADGILLTTERLERLAQFNETLDELSAMLAEREEEEETRSLEGIIEEVRMRRAQILKEKYGLTIDDG